MTVENENGRIEIDPVGAHVLSYVPAGGDDVLFRSSADRAYAQWYHGGIPICWPWFNLQGDPGSVKHGFARMLKWDLVEQTDGPQESRLVFGLTSDVRSKGQFPGDFELRLEVVLGRSMRLGLTMKNTGRERFAVTTGFHPYFRIGRLDRVSVRTPTGDIACSPGMDGARPLAEGEYVIVDRQMERRIRLKTWGNRKLIVWNVGDKPVAGFAEAERERYVCVEPVIVPRGEGLWLEPGQCHEIGLEIRAVSGGAEDA